MKEELVLETTKEIYGWGFTSDYIESMVKGYDKKKYKKMIVPINSYGGDVMEGLAVYNMLKGFDGEVETRIVGYAMSMGTIIALAGDVVCMPENGYFMIHEPSGMEWGDADMMASMANLLDDMGNMMANIYSEKTGIPADEIRGMMKAETWLSGKKAFELGFVDKLTPGVKYEASFSASKFKNAPNEIKAVESNKEAQIDEKILSINSNKNHTMNFINSLGEFLGFKAKGESGEPEMTPDKFFNALEEKVSTSVISKVEASTSAISESIDSINSKLSGFQAKEDADKMQEKLEAALTTISSMEETIKELKASSDDKDKALAKLIGADYKSPNPVDGAPDYTTSAEVKLKQGLGVIQGKALEELEAAFDNLQ